MTDAPPVVAAQEHAGDPHYTLDPANPRQIGADEVVLLDLWGKLPTPGAVYADITWVGFTGSTVPDRYGRRSRPRGTDATRRWPWCRNVQRAAAIFAATRSTASAATSSTRAGYGSAFIHRTGHSLGTEVHGNGVHMDDYETRDDRRLIPGTGFTIEPGIYTAEFGVRTEINMFVSEGAAHVTGPLQTAFVLL